MWVSKNRRPEEKGSFESEFVRYNLRSTQEKIALRAIELASPRLGGRALDAGCGNGFGLKVLNDLGFVASGFDASKKMVSEAKKNGFRVKHGLFQKIPFKEKFGFVLSVSALQWVSLPEMQLVVKEFWRVMAKPSLASIQLYAKSEEELFEYAKAFRSVGFSVKVTQDNYENAKKRKTYLVLKKE